MPQTVTCPSCGATLRLPAVGCPEVASCPRCKKPMRRRAPDNGVSPARPAGAPGAAPPVKKPAWLNPWWLAWMGLAGAETARAARARAALAGACQRLQEEDGRRRRTSRVA